MSAPGLYCWLLSVISLSWLERLTRWWWPIGNMLARMLFWTRHLESDKLFFTYNFPSLCCVVLTCRDTSKFTRERFRSKGGAKRRQYWLAAKWLRASLKWRAMLGSAHIHLCPLTSDSRLVYGIHSLNFKYLQYI